MRPKGFLALVLHAHLPFVRHPEHERCLEEEWLFEAITETYLPLLEVFETLVHDGVPYGVTLSLSPTLLAMLTDPLLQSRYLRYLDERLRALAGEHARTQQDRQLHPLVLFYERRYEQLRQRFAGEPDITRAFRRLMESGHLEILTSAATHGYLPLLAAQPRSLDAQLAMAVRTHERILGRSPRGIWLPECGYLPGFDRILDDFGLDHFFLESHGILNAEPRPRHGVHRPLHTPAGPVAFGRDFESSLQVWSADSGFPGDSLYRDFYRDAGFDIDAPHMLPLRHAGTPGFTGLKYHRVTGKGAWKELYRPEWAHVRAAQHADHFLQDRGRQAQRLAPSCDAPPVIVAAYDAELFGHWWFEGPQWIDSLLRAVASGQHWLETVTSAGYLDCYCNRLQTAAAAESSWGAGGFHEVWLNDSNDWIYPHLHAAVERMVALQRRFPDCTGTTREALDQAARELLLAQTSDWAFIMRTGTAVDYAVRRFKTHIHRFHRLGDMTDPARYDESYLRAVAARDNPFPDIDYRIFREGYRIPGPAPSRPAGHRHGAAGTDRDRRA